MGSRGAVSPAELLELGGLKLSTGDSAGAIAAYEGYLPFAPDKAVVYNNLGVAQMSGGRYNEAITSFEAALRLQPNYHRPLVNLGKALREVGRPNEAIERVRHALRLNPDYPPALVNLGCALCAVGDSDAAEATLSRAIRLAPNLIEARVALAELLSRAGRAQEALSSLEAAIAQKPDDPTAHIAHAMMLLRVGLGSPDAAIDHLRHALRLTLDYPPALVSLGCALCAVGDFDAAEATLRRAVRLAPDLTDARVGLSELLWQSGRAQEALSSLEAAIAQKPDDAVAHVARAMMLLRTGSYLEGWAEYEWRWRQSALHRDLRHGSLPLWVGRESLAGKTILLHAEQGYGDALQFCRYARLVSAQGAKVILEVPSALQRLMRTLEGVARVISPHDPTPEADFHCPLMSLPLAFGTTLETIPAGQRYLSSEPELVERWRPRLAQRHGLRVGLVWSGGFRPHHPETWSINARRNINLEILAELRHPQIEYVSLQKGLPAEAEAQELQRRGWSGPTLIDCMSAVTDFAETAALIENLDLVVSVDTSTAHLAAAMGKPTWLLSRFDSCWRWLMDRSDSPWYPSVRLFRQSAPMSWAGAIRQLRDELFRLVASQPLPGRGA
jgi:tetratricopeptide (TPR) repeat protein